jgi:hypothetical protein
MKNFAFIRMHKIRSWGRGYKSTRSNGRISDSRHWGTQGTWEHDMRLIATPNADPARFKQNAIACQESGWRLTHLNPKSIQDLGCRDPEFIERKTKKLLGDKGIVARKDQVKVAMLLAAVSPEFLRDGHKDGKLNKEKVVKWANGTLNFLRRKYGERLLSVVVHMDETNPHLSAYVVPLLEKEVRIPGRRKKKSKDQPKESARKWRLSAKDLFTADPYRKEKGKDGKIRKIRTGKGTCSLLQDEYAAHLEATGLKVRRGVRRAPFQKGLEHETNRLRYERLSAPVADIEGMNDKDLRLWALDNAPQAQEAQRARTERDHYQVAAANAQEEVEDLKKQIEDSQRSLPVAEVIEKLFGIAPRQTVQGETQFVLPLGQKISINTKLNRFENLTPEIPLPSKRNKGKGALDAVCYLTGWNPIQASEWIADNFDVQSAKSAMSERVGLIVERTKDDAERQVRAAHSAGIAKELETAEPSQWNKVARTLELGFKIAPEHFQKLHRDNWLNANKFGHLVATKGCWDKAHDIVPTGKIVIDLNNPETALKETGDNGLVFMPKAKSETAIFCSCPLDALAIQNIPEHASTSVYVVGSPSEKTLPACRRLIKAHKSVRLAESLSRAGHKLALWFKKHFPSIALLKLPRGSSSWLEFRTGNRANQGRQPHPFHPKGFNL